MLKHPFATLVPATLMACSTPAIEPQLRSPLVQSEPSAAAAISMPEILGQWDVVSFEGYEPAPRQGSTRVAYADFGEQGVHLRIECNISSVSGTVRNSQFVSQRELRLQTEMGCGQEREERDARFFSFFDRSPRIERIGDLRLRMVAGDSILVLERPERRRLASVPHASVLEGTWRMEELTHYGRNGGHSGIGLSDVPGQIVINGNRLSYSLCPKYDLTFSYGSDGRLMKMGGLQSLEKLECPSLNYPDYKAPALPSAMEILPLLHSNPWIEDLGDGRLLIANERFGLLLTRRAERR